MSTATHRFFLLTGEPGVGKTTLTKKICSSLKEKGVNAVGFYTEEVRRGRTRDGFDVVTLDGERARLARDQALMTSPVEAKVGKYGVLVKEFEELGLSALNKAKADILVIDEIGKMEFFSAPFKNKIREVFSHKSQCIILATIPARKVDPLIEAIRNDMASKVWTLTRENRNNLLEEILQHIVKALQK